MNQRAAIGHFLLIVLAGLSSMQCCFGTEPRMPNILMIVSDDQAWTDYSFMGHPHIKTPHIDRLARESITFRRG